MKSQLSYGQQSFLSNVSRCQIDTMVTKTLDGANGDLSPKSPPALRGVLEVKSLTSSGHLVHDPSLQEFHRWQVIPNSECGLRQL